MKLLDLVITQLHFLLYDQVKESQKFLDWTFYSVSIWIFGGQQFVAKKKWFQLFSTLKINRTSKFPCPWMLTVIITEWCAHYMYILYSMTSVVESNKVLFTDRCRWLNFWPSLLRLVNNCVEYLQDAKTRTKVLPSATIGEQYFSSDISFRKIFLLFDFY